MTYNLSKIVEKEMKIILLKTNNSGNLSANDIIDINTTAIYNNTQGTTVNTNNIVLSTGYYLIECCLGIVNNDDIANYAEWNILIDDVEQDTKGSSTQDNKVGIDGSVTSLVIESGTKTLKLKITSVGGTCSIDNDYSYLIIKKVSL
tara:strand:- start:1630 stop:2070 length:441 start_codon:yes stop_codon:yes gene_type:complete